MMMMMIFFTEKYTHLSDYLLVGQTVGSLLTLACRTLEHLKRSEK